MDRLDHLVAAVGEEQARLVPTRGQKAPPQTPGENSRVLVNPKLAVLWGAWKEGGWGVCVCVWAEGSGGQCVLAHGIKSSGWA